MVAELERITPDEMPWYMRHLYRLHAARYHFAAAEVVGKSVLDVACGAGYGARILADAGALAVYGVDNSA